MALGNWRRQHIELDGLSLAVHRRGSGFPFYWCHGITSNSMVEASGGLQPWQQLGSGWEMILTDLRGHGDSSGSTDPDDYLWPRLASDLLALQDSLGHSRVIAGGTSMGAAVTLHAAVAAPERFAALVLMIPPTAWQARLAESRRYLADADLVERDGVEGLIEAESQWPPVPFLAGVYDPAQAARVRMAAIDAANVPAILRGAARSDLPDPAAIRELSQPVLLMAWEGDPGHPLSTTQRLAELLPHATVVVALGLDDLMSWPDHVAGFCANVSA